MNAIHRRGRLVVVVLALVALFYAIAIVLVRPFGVPREQRFASEVRGGGVPLELYVDVVSIDPIRQSMELRVDVATGNGPGGTHYDGIAQRDVDLRVGDGQSEQGFRIRRDAPLAPNAASAGIEGWVGRYPFDAYAATVDIGAYESSPGGSRPLPIRATVWEGVPGWAIRVTRTTSPTIDDRLSLAFEAARPASAKFFACVLFGIMVVVAVSALTFGGLVFVGRRRIEVTIVGALTAMLFSLPVLRNVLPGSPPIGIVADVLVLLWAELAVGVGLALLVVAWARRGPEP